MSVTPASRRVRVLGFCSNLCWRLVCWRCSLPLPVTRTRLAVPLCVLFFGMVKGFSSQGRSRVGCRLTKVRSAGLLGLGRRLARGAHDLGVLVRGHDHHHVAAVLLGRGLHEAELLDVVGQSLQQPEAELRPGLLAPAEHDGDLDLVARTQEPLHVTLLCQVVVRVDLRPELHLLDDGEGLVAAGLTRLLRALVLELAVVHELADRRPGHRSHLDRIELGFLGQPERILDAHDADLLALGTDEPYFGDADPVVDAGLGADGASSVSGQERRSRRPRSTGPEACRPAATPRPPRRTSTPAGPDPAARRRRLGWERELRLRTPAWAEAGRPAQVTPCERSSGPPRRSPVACRACKARSPRTAATARGPSEAWTASTAIWSSSASSRVAHGEPSRNATARTTSQGTSLVEKMLRTRRPRRSATTSGRASSSTPAATSRPITIMATWSATPKVTPSLLVLPSSSAMTPNSTTITAAATAATRRSRTGRARTTSSAGPAGAPLTPPSCPPRPDPSDPAGQPPSTCSPDSMPKTTSWARSRAPSFSMARLTCVRTVAGLSTRVSAISSLDRPVATQATISRSRSVRSPSLGCGATRRPPAPANCLITRRVTLGDSSEPPSATTRTARSSSAGSASLSTKPLAPAASASKTYSSSSKVVSMTTRTPASAGSAVTSRSAASPSSTGIRTSISTTSGSVRRIAASPARPSSASATSSVSGSVSSSARRPIRTSGWSSTTATRTGVTPAAPPGPGTRRRRAARPTAGRRPTPPGGASRRSPYRRTGPATRPRGRPPRRSAHRRARPGRRPRRYR